MAIHTIEPTRETLHGTFSRELEPVLTIDSGDTVQYQTLDARWGLEPYPLSSEERREFSPRHPEHDTGHALCGPVAVRGAEPGMALGIHINQIRTGDYGWNVGGGRDRHLERRLGVVEDGILLRWQLDSTAMTATSHLGNTIGMRPFLGVMGMPPDEAGRHPTGPPRVTGGNIDCKELIAGTTLYLPISVAGGLFSTGDGHAVQGDGEISGTAIECPMDLAELTFTLHENMRISTPRALTQESWLTFGFNEDLDEAMFTALNAMLDLMHELHDLDRPTAVALASVAVDLRVTQVVNGVQGVHAVLPHGAVN